VRGEDRRIRSRGCVRKKKKDLRGRGGEKERGYASGLESKLSPVLLCENSRRLRNGPGDSPEFISGKVGS